jgi:hypothetical protein
MKLRPADIPIWLLAWALGGCYNAPVARAPSSDNAWAKGIIAHASKYCLEEGYQPETAHFDDCVKNKAIGDALEERMLQQAASGQYAVPSQVYVLPPTNSSCVPDVRGMSAGAAFAAGLRGC